MGKPKPKSSVAANSKGPSATTRNLPSTRNLAKSLVSKPSPKVDSSERNARQARQSTSTNLKAAVKIELVKAEAALSKPSSRKKKKDKRDSSSTSSSFVPDEGEGEEGSSEEEEFAKEDVEDDQDQYFVKPQTVTRKQSGEESKRQSFGRAAALVQPTYVTMSGRISHTHQSSTAAKSPMNESSADEYTQSSRSVALLGSLQSAAAASTLSSGDRADASSLIFTSRKRPASSLSGSPARNRTKRTASTNEAKKQSTSSKSSPLQKGKPSSNNSKTAASFSIKPSASILKKGTTASKSKSAPNSPQGKSKRLSKISSSKDVFTVIPVTLPSKKAHRNAKSAPASAYSSPSNSSKKKSPPKQTHPTSTSPSFFSKNKKSKQADQAMDVDTLPSVQKVKAEEATNIPVPKQSITEKPAGATTCGNQYLIIEKTRHDSLTLYILDQCRAAKKGCAGGVPCSRCITRGHTCTFKNPPKRPPGWGTGSFKKTSSVAIATAGVGSATSKSLGGVSARSRAESIVKKKVVVAPGHGSAAVGRAALVRKKPPPVQTVVKKLQGVLAQPSLQQVQRASPVQVQPQSLDDYVAFFGDKLSKEDADVTKCMPTKADRDMFDTATAIVKVWFLVCIFFVLSVSIIKLTSFGW